MGAVASQITSLTIVYPTVYSGADQRKHQNTASLAFVLGNSPVTGGFPSQMASNAENVSIWWRHHETKLANVEYHMCLFAFYTTNKSADIFLNTFTQYSLVVTMNNDISFKYHFFVQYI